MKKGPFGLALGKEDYRRDGIPIIGIENIGENAYIRGSKKFVSREKARVLSSYALFPGDIIISRSGTVGQVCVIPPDVDGVMSTNLIRIRLNGAVAEPNFIALVLNGSRLVAKQVTELCSGSTRDFLNHTILERLTLPIPPLSEQIFILEAISRFESLFSSMQISLEKCKASCDCLF